MNRPALQKLKEDIKAGKIDIIVIYKIDCLTRSLSDFSELQEFFDEYGVSFVSVTQEINTSTSAGRMMLNILMTFAQYEREIIAERVRYKVAAAKKRGKNCGGVPILGYDTDPTIKRLMVNEKEAKTVRHIFKSYLEKGSAKAVSTELELKGIRGKSWTTRKGVARVGQKINNQMIYRMLNNKLYIGMVEHKGNSYKGEHDAIIDREIWDTVQIMLKSNMNHDSTRKTKKSTRLRAWFIVAVAWKRSPLRILSSGARSVTVITSAWRIPSVISAPVLLSGYRQTPLKIGFEGDQLPVSNSHHAGAVDE